MNRYITAFLVILSLTLNNCGRECVTTFSLTGTVTDALYNPLPAVGVTIRLHDDDPDKTLNILGLTDSQGTYNVNYTRSASISGDHLEFVKAGYVISVADKFNLSENATCSPVTLRRDAVLQLQ
jgi:hypothetical protein